MASHATQPAVRTGTGGDARRPAALWLPALFLLAFSFGTDDMVIAGILPDIARDLAVSVPLSGQLVTVFAVAYALGAPPAALLTARLPRRTVLVAAAGVFVVANLAAAAAPAYGALLAAGPWRGWPRPPPRPSPSPWRPRPRRRAGRAGTWPSSAPG